jgi:hypothetical protein
VARPADHLVNSSASYLSRHNAALRQHQQHL